MPSWLKKQFKSLKLEVSEHLWLAKNKNRLNDRHKKNGSGVGNDASDHSPIIRNDLQSNRRHNKNDKNAYRDYSKRCEEVLFYQNNCALRCAQEATKPSNVEQNDNNNVKKTDADAGQKTCVKIVKNGCDNAASSERCDRNCEFICTQRTIIISIFSRLWISRLSLGVLGWNKKNEMISPYVFIMWNIWV